MNLKTLTMRRFLDAMADVQERMKDRQQCGRLLDAARADTPLVNDLVGVIVLLYQKPDNELIKEARRAAERDLLIILALRQIAGQEITPSVPTRIRGRSITSSQPWKR